MLFIVSFLYPIIALPGEVTQAEKMIAEYVFNFAKYTVWPALKSSAPITLCVKAKPETFDVYKQFNDQQVAAHTIEVIEYTHSILQDCEILYLGKKLASFWSCDLHKAYPGILAISNHSDFLSRCGLIQLYQEANILYFEINYAALLHSSLQLNSYLFTLPLNGPKVNFSSTH